MTDIKVPDAIAEWARGMVSDSMPTQATEAAKFIVSLLPPPPEPTLREKLTSLAKEYTGYLDWNPDVLVDEILDTVRMDLKDKFGWETRITSYLKGE
jgi:hypothetical protein